MSTATITNTTRDGEVSLNNSAIFEAIKYVPHEGQLAVHNSRARWRVLACGVRWGKTTASAVEGVLAALYPRPEGSVGWVVGPHYNLADKCYQKIVDLFREYFPAHIIKQNSSERYLQVYNLAGGRSTIQAKSADIPEQLLGEGLNWVICDEASRLKPRIWTNYISQRLIDKRGWALLISTPCGKGWFYDIWRKGKTADGGMSEDGYQSWNAPSWQNPLLSKADIEAERGKISWRSFSQEYEAQFIEGSGSVFTRINECMTGPGFGEPVPGETYYAGCDLAKVDDYTAITIVSRDGRVMHAERHRRMDWDQIIAKLRGVLERYNDAKCYVDSTGRGEPIFDRMATGGMRVMPYEFTSRTKQDLINNLSVLMEGGKIQLPNRQQWPEGIEELENFEYDISDSGTVRMGAPKGQHDDCVISLALACWKLKQAKRTVAFYA